MKALKHHINIGDVFQIVPSRRFSLACPNTLASYAQLKQNIQSPYMFYMNDEDFILFGASPESALKYEPENRQLEIYPIAKVHALVVLMLMVILIRNWMHV